MVEDIILFICHCMEFQTWKKLARLSIAIAGYMVSTNLDYTQIVVREDHVKIAVALLRSIYDNPIFKLREFVNEERKTLTCKLSDINFIKEKIKRFPALMDYLENNNNIAKNTLYTISGVDLSIFNGVIQELSKEHLITLTKDKIYCNPKLIIGIKKAREALASEGVSV